MLVILSFSVTALLGVELVYPKIEIEKQPDNVVFFKCNVTEADNIRLFTNKKEYDGDYNSTNNFSI